jgi:hypothetical protein
VMGVVMGVLLQTIRWCFEPRCAPASAHRRHHRTLVRASPHA